MKLVKIVWKDARSIGEVFADDLDDFFKVPSCTFIGFLLRENEEAILLASGFLPKIESHDDEIYRHVMIIPKAMIVEMKELKEIEAK